MKTFTIPNVDDSLNNRHNVTLTEAQISTILYVLEGYVQGNDDYSDDNQFKTDVDSIFETLEGVVDKFYAQQERIEQQIEWYNKGVELENVTNEWYDENGNLKHE